MNSYDADYKDYLQVGKLADSLTTDEEYKFQLFMQTDPSFQEAFFALAEKLSIEKLDALSKFKDAEIWDDVTHQFMRRSLVDRYGITQIAVSAVIIIGLMVSLFFALRPSTNKQSDNIKIADAPQPSIKIQLANGKTIDLTATKGSIRTELATINNSGDNLTYSTTDSAGSSKMNSLIVSSGKEYHITLSDGTNIWLNSATKLDFPFAFIKNRREISIDGEAYLEVAKNANKPFIVHLKNGDVEVIGTEFNVNTYESTRNTVSLVNGSVNFSARQEIIKLIPGEEVSSSNEKLILRHFEANKVLSWRKGLLYFDQTPIHQIASNVERLFNVKVVIDNTRNNKKRYVGVLNRNEPLQEFLDALDLVSDIDSYFDKGGILHFK